MTSQTRAIHAIETLVRSDVRVQLLNAIRRRRGTESQVLREQLDADRTTIQRNLDALEEAGWIDYEYGTGYTLTPCGELIATEFFAFVETMQAGLKLQPVFRWLDPSDIDIDLRLFADAEIVVAEQHDPYAPMNRHIELLEDAEHFRALLPSVGLQAIQVAHEHVITGDAQHELVVSPGVAETIRAKATYADLVAELLATDACTIYEADEPLPYYLGLAGSTTQLGIEDANGKPQALIESEAATVVEWADRTYAAYRADADPLEPPRDVVST